MRLRAGWVDSVKQAIKTGVAGLISLYITALFHLPQGYWAAISAFIVMQSNIGATVSASRTRLAGTAVGAIIGGIFDALFGNSMLAFALAAAIAFFLCGLFRLAESQRLSTVTVAIVMLTAPANAAWLIAVHRFSEVALGIVVALVVSLTLWPNHARRGVRHGIAESLIKMATFYSAVMRNYRLLEGASIEPLKRDVAASIRRNSDLLASALKEALGPLHDRESLALLAHQAERVFGAVESLEFAVRDSSTDSYFRRFDPDIGELQDRVSGAFQALSKKAADPNAKAEWPELEPWIGKLDDEAAQARKAGQTIAYPLDEILRYYSLLLSSRNLIAELEVARSLLGGPVRIR